MPLYDIIRSKFNCAMHAFQIDLLLIIAFVRRYILELNLYFDIYTNTFHSNAQFHITLFWFFRLFLTMTCWCLLNNSFLIIYHWTWRALIHTFMLLWIYPGNSCTQLSVQMRMIFVVNNWSSSIEQRMSLSKLSVLKLQDKPHILALISILSCHFEFKRKFLGKWLGRNRVQDIR